MRGIACVGVVCACLVAVPAAAYAQASITGVVRDASGAVLPGVTVETTSPVLIEKVRTVVSDGSGQYRIITLPPGTYAVTFTLPGFRTVRREGLELSGTFTATVDAELLVGGVEESILVTGESPLVDVQSSTQQRVITTDVVDAIPSGRMPANLVVLIPGINVAGGGSNYSGFGAHDVGGAAGDMAAIYSIHGGEPQDSRTQLNGVSTGWGNEGWESWFHPNMAAIEEVVVDTAGSAEVDIGGVRANLIPRNGGNQFSGTIFAGFSNESLSFDNLDDDLTARGYPFGTSVKVNGDFNPGFGGPIIRDRLWFFAAGRYLKASNYIGGVYIDATQYDQSVFAYTPDLNRKATVDNTWKDAVGRATWQATPRHKLAFSFWEQTSCKCPSNVTFTSPSGTYNRHGHPLRVVTSDWTAPITTRLLFDASMFYYYNRWSKDMGEAEVPGMIPIDEQSTGQQLKIRSGSLWENLHTTLRYRASMSYVTGAHAFKVGFVNAYATMEYNHRDPVFRYRTNLGVPNRITMNVLPLLDLFTLDAEPGLFVQDRWTVDRLTLNLGLRYDYKRTHFPETIIGDPNNPFGPARFAPVPFTVPRTEQLRWHDVTPRTGLVYDLFGNGRTAVRASLNKYLSGEEVTLLGNPRENLVLVTTRSWRDDGNRTPDCDLFNPVANGECGAMANPNFGKLTGGAAQWDPETLSGWGVRRYNWEFSTGVQTEITSGVSMDFGYFRRSYGNMYVTDDRALTAADFDAFSIPAPSDSRLPDGGGYTLSGLKDLKPTSFGRAADNFVTFAKEYGKQIRRWNGVDLSVNVRAGGGLTLQGGLSTGRTSTDNCEIVDQLPEVSALIPRDYCHVDTKFLTQVKFLSSYLIPRVDVQVSGSVQSLPGPEILANYVASSALVAQSLGRPLAGGEANVTVNLIKPGTMYGERLNQLDVRLAKILRFGGSSTSLNLDIFNVLNGNAVTTESSAFGNWRRPTNTLLGRNLKISAQYNF